MPQTAANAAAARTKAAQLKASQADYARAQASDGALAATATTAGSAARFTRDPLANAPAALQRVASQEVLDPLVLPAPQTAAITAPQAARLLQRLDALRGTTAPRATRAKDEDRDDDAAVPEAAAVAANASARSHVTGTAASATDAATASVPSATFTPEMLRYAKNEIGLSPRAMRMLAALTANGAAAATVDATAPTNVGREPVAKASIAPVARDGVANTSVAPVARDVVADDSATGTQVSGPAGYNSNVSRKTEVLTLPTPSGEAMEVTTKLTQYVGEISWTAFAALISRDQLEAVASLALLRMVSLSFINFSQTLLNQAEVLRQQNEILGEQFQQMKPLAMMPMTLRANWIEGRSRVARNINPNLSPFESEFGLKLETNSRSPEILARMQELADQARANDAKAKDAVDGVRRDKPLGEQILTALPPGHPAGQLQRDALTPSEIRALRGDLGSSYRSQASSLQKEEEMDRSSQFGRYAQEATKLEQASEAFAAAQRQAKEPVQELHFGQMAQAYADKAREMRALAAKTGYLGTVPTGVRANRQQYKIAITTELRDLERWQPKVAWLQKEVDQLKANKQLDTDDGKRRVHQLAVANKAVAVHSHRISAMHAIVAACENLEGQRLVNRYPSGHQAMVEKLDGIFATIRSGTPAEQQQAEQRLKNLSATQSADVIGANVLDFYWRNYVGSSAAQASPRVQDALRTLRDPRGDRQAQDQAVDVLHRGLRNHAPAREGANPLLPPYEALLGDIGQSRMARHVGERAAWDRAGRDEQAAAQTFWARNSHLKGDGANANSRVRRALDALMPAPGSPLTPKPRHGSANLPDGTSADLDPIHRLARPQDVDMLDPKAASKHLQDQVENAKNWAQNYSDPVYDRLNMGQQLLGQVDSNLRDITQRVQGMADDSAGELLSQFDEARLAFYGAMQSERSSTLGLVDQLRSLLQIG